jgi:hypothetical protein
MEGLWPGGNAAGTTEVSRGTTETKLLYTTSKKYTLGTDPKENTTSERTPKKITDLELTKNKTPPLHSNNPPSPSNTHTKKASQPVSLLYIYIEDSGMQTC